MRRRLDVELVRRGLVGSRTKAVEAIERGGVTVAGAPADRPARLVDAAEPIVVAGAPPRFVSRGGEKLAAAIVEFGVEMADRRCLDAGASTGGFTDCLLQRGAAHVYAVDVGRGQLAWSLRNDDRVTVLERTDLRDVTTEQLDGPCDVTTIDLSFISLRRVVPALLSLTTEFADHLLLVKPQFEAGRARVGKGGVVRDKAVHVEVLTEITGFLQVAGLIPIAVMPSPLRGADGNVEFMVHGRKTGMAVSDARLAAVVDTAHEE